MVISRHLKLEVLSAWVCWCQHRQPRLVGRVSLDFANHVIGLRNTNGILVHYERKNRLRSRYRILDLVGSWRHRLRINDRIPADMKNGHCKRACSRQDRRIRHKFGLKIHSVDSDVSQSS